MKLIISDADVSRDTLRRFRNIEEGAKVLDEAELADTVAAVYDALPQIVTRRVKKIVPPDFVVSEIALTMSLGGSILGVDVSGDIEVTLTPSIDKTGKGSRG